jgi:hypothetical protein
MLRGYRGMISANSTCDQTFTQDKGHIRRVIGIFDVNS